MSLNCVLIGAGNVATHLGGELVRKGFKIEQVYSRTEHSARVLAQKLNCSFTTEVSNLSDANIYFIALKDSAIHEVLGQFEFNNRLIVHCSGSVPMTVLKDYSENYGVFYPLQTFSKNKQVEFFKIPLLIEANSEKNLEIINSIAWQLSGKVKMVNSEERLHIHIAAVFVCNFVNYLYTVGELILNENGFSFDILKPLIKETADKVKTLSPADAQTGPAVRFDRGIIDKHLKVLEGNKEFAELYKSISESIFALHQRKG